MHVLAIRMHSGVFVLVQSVCCVPCGGNAHASGISRYTWYEPALALQVQPARYTRGQQAVPIKKRGLHDTVLVLYSLHGRMFV